MMRWCMANGKKALIVSNRKYVYSQTHTRDLALFCLFVWVDSKKKPYNDNDQNKLQMRDK